ASPDLLLRAGVATGATLLVGGRPFTILGVDRSEPDRLTGGLGIGPRLLMTAGGLRRTGIVQFGSQVTSRLLFQLEPGAPSLDGVEAALQRPFAGFRGDRILDFRHANPALESGLDHSTSFLSLVSLMALIVGALGVASAMHAHLQLRLDSIATMKVLGARNLQIVRIYGLQTLLLGLAGGVAGIGLGAAVERVFPRLLAPFFPSLPPLGWAWGPAAEGLAAGVLVTLLFTVPPLLGVRRIPPAWILRRHMPEPGRGRAAGRLETALAGLLLLAGLALLAVALTDQPWGAALRLGGYFLGGVAAGVAALALVTWALLRLLRRLVAAWSVRGSPPTALRHGLANLYRPGSQAQAVLVALGLGVMFTLSVYLLQRALLADLERDTPPGVANVFLIDIPAAQSAAVEALLHAQPGRENTPEILGTVGARMFGPRRNFNPGPGAGRGRRGRGFRFASANAGLATFAAAPSGIDLVQGRWWVHPDPTRPQLAVSEEFAARWGLRLGDRVYLSAGGRGFPATLAVVYRPQPHRLIARLPMIVSPGPLAGVAANVNGGVRMAPEAIPALERAMFQRFPTVTVVNLADVIERVQAVVSQIALVVHFVSFFAVLAGAIILASSVAGTRFRRMREIAVLKTCGATAAAVARIFSTEFLLLGLVAGAAGAALALGFSTVVSHRVLQLPLGLSLRTAALPALAAVALTVAVALAAGWLASARLLRLKPLAVLRAE
ncbi:MAG: ABC transporter permease, partial [Terriglobales bacterium]